MQLRCSWCHGMRLSAGPFQSALNQACTWEGELWASGFLVCLVCEHHGSRPHTGQSCPRCEVEGEGDLTQVPSRGARLALERGFWSSQGPRASALSGSSSPWPAPPAGSRAPLLKERVWESEGA